MVFSSMTFIYLFLPIVCLTYLLVRKEARNIVLLFASILFYAWGEPLYLSIMFLTVLTNYLGALAISKYQAHKKIFLLLCLVINLSFLVYFKYFNFLLETLQSVTKAEYNFIDVIMPIGISFYTFQALSYLVDVYRNEVKVQRNFYNLALYISFFPQLVAGPIVKYKDIEEQILGREESFEKVSYGVKRFVVGLSKKVLIANNVGLVADNIYAVPLSELDALSAWIGALCYSLQLYYDFSGYSDMAIGIGAIFGFKFLENFNYPYISRSITEFWRRWHISLSTWFKEYLYIPLGGNRVSPTRVYINLFIVFFATGLWHGASWNFIIWGLWNGLFIIFEKASSWHKEKQNLFLKIVQHLYVIFIFIVGWVLFRSPDMTYALAFLEKMFIPSVGFISSFSMVKYEITNISIIAFVVGIICSIPLFSKMLDVSEEEINYILILKNIYLFVLLFLSTLSIAASTYNPFIYFRF